MSLILDGKVAATELKEKLKEKISLLPSNMHLAIIHFNEPSSLSYLKGRKKIAAELQVEVDEFPIDDMATEEEIIHLIQELNKDPQIDGIMLDRPLPKKYHENTIVEQINPLKDVDGYTPINLGKMLANQPCFLSCTPGGSIALLDYYNINVEGKNALIIGRSLNVGKPLALMLLNKNATVTIAHSKTHELKEKTKQADIIFLALGKANFLHLEDVKKDVIVVDIGINYDENNKLCGDASRDLYDQVYAYSPVPGGVGVMTNVVLMQNLYEAYLVNHHGKL